MQGALNLEYLHADEVAGYLKENEGHVLGLVAFGSHLEGHYRALRPSPLWAHIPVLGLGLDTVHNYPGTSFEVWSSAYPVSSYVQGNISAAADGTVLFGSLQMDQIEGTTFGALVKQAYLEIFSFMERQGYRHLLRTWNYFPDITGTEDGLERYRCFNLGRHEAYAATGRDTAMEGVPAASVLGSREGPLLIYFLAGMRPGHAIENPRQVNPHRYPDQYGPRSPTFVRAMLATFGRQQCLAISGTASIVGYETMHPGDVDKQAQETLLNIRTLLKQVPALDQGGGRMLLKVYLRHAADLERVRNQVKREFGTNHKAVYLLSDICRTDLLMEIEGVCFGRVEG